MDRQNGLSCLLLGLGIGAAGAILFAPKNGLEARNYVRSKAEEGTDYVKCRGDILLQQASETIKPLKENLRRPVVALADAIDAGKRAYRDTVKNGHAASLTCWPD
jgi:gas vesicle protein